ncbi:MAG: glutathione S-transferase family protein [Hyphomonadaceae bacterium]|nr:glutathione S-transferase family protein [Hyphomonadaceae bacterium]
MHKDQAPILFGMPGSLYTAKARSYLRKARIAYEERCVGDPRFHAEIAPKIGRFIMPVVEMPGGVVLQDTADIIDHFEAAGQGPWRAAPENPVMRVIAGVLDLFGGEGLLRPAMHYRWNFDAENLEFLRADFCAALAPAGDADVHATVFGVASARMRKAMAAFGVTPQTQPAIEASYGEFLALFEAHLAGAPYLLGGRPTLADYGFIGPLFAHLARDPYPAQLMKRQAPRVWRWVERMNAPDLNAGEYVSADASVFTESPPTLMALLRFVAQDFLPDLAAQVAFANRWLDERPDIEVGSNGCPRPGDRSIGFANFAWRGHELRVAVMPYRFFMLQRIQDAFAQAEQSARGVIEDLFDDVGLSPLLTLRTRRRVERRNYLEVWGATQS